MNFFNYFVESDLVDEDGETRQLGLILIQDTSGIYLFLNAYTQSVFLNLKHVANGHPKLRGFYQISQNSERKLIPCLLAEHCIVFGAEDDAIFYIGNIGAGQKNELTKFMETPIQDVVYCGRRKTLKIQEAGEGAVPLGKAKIFDLSKPEGRFGEMLRLPSIPGALDFKWSGCGDLVSVQYIACLEGLHFSIKSGETPSGQQVDIYPFNIDDDQACGLVRSLSEEKLYKVFFIDAQHQVIITTASVDDANYSVHMLFKSYIMPMSMYDLPIYHNIAELRCFKQNNMDKECLASVMPHSIDQAQKRLADLYGLLEALRPQENYLWRMLFGQAQPKKEAVAKAELCVAKHDKLLSLYNGVYLNDIADPISRLKAKIFLIMAVMHWAFRKLGAECEHLAAGLDKYVYSLNFLKNNFATLSLEMLTTDPLTFKKVFKVTKSAKGSSSAISSYSPFRLHFRSPMRSPDSGPGIRQRRWFRSPFSGAKFSPGVPAK